MASELAENVAAMEIDPAPPAETEAAAGSPSETGNKGEEPAAPASDNVTASNGDKTDEAAKKGDDESSLPDLLNPLDEYDEDDSCDEKENESTEAELLLIKANNLKEEGNGFFKEQDFEKASRSYRRGVNALKPLNKANSGDAQVKALLVSLQTNLSLMQFKLGNFKHAKMTASKALQIDPVNIKALYRRAVAHRKMGNTTEARTDLREILKADPVNVSAKKELASIKKQLETIKEQQKKSFSKAFSSNKGSFLYDDKQVDEAKLAEERKKQQQQQEEEQKKRKALWEDECVKRMAKGEDAITFEDWEKEEKAKEDAEKKKKAEEEKKRQEERRKAREAEKAAKKANGEDSDDDEDKLTEKELAELRGYKKTKDGRVTSYFTREQSAEEKQLLGDIAPKRLEPAAASSTPQPISPDAVGEGKGNPSAWNAARTWEEKDTTEWCRQQLETRLKESSASVEGSSIHAVVKAVKNMTGEASVALASGKKRYIFDFHCTLEFEILDADTDDIYAKGSLKIPDICSTHHEELEINFGGWSKKPSGDHETVAIQRKDLLFDRVRASVTKWVEDFNSHY